MLFSYQTLSIIQAHIPQPSRRAATFISLSACPKLMTAWPPEGIAVAGRGFCTHVLKAASMAGLIGCHCRMDKGKKQLTSVVLSGKSKTPYTGICST